MITFIDKAILIENTSINCRFRIIISGCHKRNFSYVSFSYRFQYHRQLQNLLLSLLLLLLFLIILLLLLLLLFCCCSCCCSYIKMLVALFWGRVNREISLVPRHSSYVLEDISRAAVWKVSTLYWIVSITKLISSIYYYRHLVISDSWSTFITRILLDIFFL